MIWLAVATKQDLQCRTAVQRATSGYHSSTTQLFWKSFCMLPCCIPYGALTVHSAPHVWWCFGHWEGLLLPRGLLKNSAFRGVSKSEGLDPMLVPHLIMLVELFMLSQNNHWEHSHCICHQESHALAVAAPSAITTVIFSFHWHCTTSRISFGMKGNFKLKF